jgi:hypothetical protein
MSTTSPLYNIVWNPAIIRLNFEFMDANGRHSGLRQATVLYKSLAIATVGR